MSDPKYNFQYCPKFVLFSENWSEVFLARRNGEADYDGTFSFIGGKLEITDSGIMAGMRREKNEEVGEDVRVRLCLKLSLPVLFRKKDGNSMILPHHIAQYVSGKVALNRTEYSEFRWVDIKDLAKLELKVENIPEIVDWVLRFKDILKPADFETV